MNCGGAAQKRCSECKKRGIAVYYCGRECQLRDWKAHKKHCGTAQAQNVDIQRILFVNPEEGASKACFRMSRTKLDGRSLTLVTAYCVDFSLDDFKQYFHASVDLSAQLLLDIRELHDPADVVHAAS